MLFLDLKKLVFTHLIEIRKILLSTDDFDNNQTSKAGKYIQSIVIIYWHHFAGVKGDGNTADQSVDTTDTDSSDNQCDIIKATKEIPKPNLLIDMRKDMT